MKITKTIKLSAVAVMALGNIVFAGGDISPVTAHELSDELKSAQIIPEPVKEVVIPPIAPKIVEAQIIPEPVKEVVIPPIAPKIVEEVKEDSPWYAGAGLVAGRTTNVHCEDITYGVMAKVGYDFNEYVGVEARGLRTNWEYEGSKIKHAGVFLKPQYPVSEDINLYGLLGYAKTTTSHIQNLDETGLAYGAGAEYALSEDMNLFVDYERLLEKSNVPDLDALSLGVSFDF